MEKWDEGRHAVALCLAGSINTQVHRRSCAHFSFPLYFLHERKAPQRALFKSLPADRILVETDAPDLVPPAEHNRWPITHPDTGASLNHPANLTAAYTALAELRGETLTHLSANVEENWHRLFG